MSLNTPTEKPGSLPYQLPLGKENQVHGRSLLVSDEQDLGETILLSRYLFKLKARGARVLFETCPELFNLFQNHPLLDQVVLREKTTASRSSSNGSISLASLPAVFQAASGTLPDNAPYLFADPAKTACWSEKMSGPDLKIGLQWRGIHKTAFHCSPRLLDVLFDIDGLQWYSLQNDLDPNDNIDLYGKPLIHLGSALCDFSDTAAVIANLDLIIAVDSPIAHLAGSMGKPVWVILPPTSFRHPCFQEKKRSLWYPSISLYRQTISGDWETPLAEITHDLIQLKLKRMHRLSNETVDQHYQAALSHHQQGAVESAEAIYQNLLSLVPGHLPALNALGLLYLNTQRFDAAVRTLRKAIELNPTDPLCLNNLGFAFQHLGKAASALSLFAGAITYKPDYTAAYQNIGNVFVGLNNLDAVIHWYSKALETEPDNADAHHEMGRLYLKQLDAPTARKHFERAVALAPQNVSARISLATTALMQGDFPVGWNQYRWRFKDKSIAGSTYPASFNIPQWEGEQFKHKRLIIHCEQGFGDTIQFSRFIPQVKKMGGEIIFQVQETLLPLFRHFSGVDVLQPLPTEQPVSPDADLYCPLLDLPYYLSIELPDVRIKRPYLLADPEKVAQWRRRFDPEHFSIGMVWEGNLDNANGRNRACPLSHLLELEQVNSVRLYSLQKEVRETDNSLLQSHPNVGLLGVDFANTAAAIECLDLVISVDTVVAHLAGAMGKPVWLMLPFAPDWRWMLNRTDTPWYPTMRLFRQSSENDWAGVMQSLKHNLKAVLNGR